MSAKTAIDVDGYSVARTAVDLAELRLARDAVDRIDSATARNLLADRAFARLSCSRALRRLVEPVLGPGAIAVRGILFDKRGAANWRVGWHQDTVIAVADRPDRAPAGFDAWSVKQRVPHVRPPTEVLESMLTVRLALDDADARNGALRVLPGSHRDGRLDGAAIAAAIASGDPLVCETRAGDAVLMRPLLLHASERAERPGRRVVHLEFAAESLPPPLAWPDWSKLAVD